MCACAFDDMEVERVELAATQMGPPCDAGFAKQLAAQRPERAEHGGRWRPRQPAATPVSF